MNRTKLPVKHDNGNKDVFEQLESFVKKEILRSDEKEQAGPMSYIGAFLKDAKVASIAPSTKFLIDRVVRRLPHGTKTVVEYGPANGVVTRELLAHLPKDGLLVAIETNERFVHSLSKIQDARLKVLHGNVLDLADLLKPLHLQGVDAIVSGIPFSFLKPMQRHQLIHRTEEALRPGGRFIGYQVTAHLWPLLQYHFPKVDIQYVLRNLPPNFIFTGVKAQS